MHTASSHLEGWGRSHTLAFHARAGLVYTLPPFILRVGLTFARPAFRPTGCGRIHTVAFRPKGTPRIRTAAWIFYFLPICVVWIMCSGANDHGHN